MKFLIGQRRSGGSFRLPHWIGASLIILALVLCLLPQAATAQEPQPCRFWGTVMVDGNWVADGTLITAWIDNATGSWTAETFTPSDPDPDAGKSVYVVTVSGDNLGTPAKDGGVVGDIVRFRVWYGGTDHQAAQTGVWDLGGFVRVNLTVNTTAPVATLTGQPTGWVTYDTATITVDGSDVEKYKYRLDTDDWSTTEYSVSQPIVLNNLSEAWHTLYVIGGNATAWQPESSPTEASWGVDMTAPPTPTLISPVNGERINSATPTFNWTPVSDATGVTYWLRFDDNADFSSPLATEASSTSEYAVPESNPLQLGSYHWAVKAVDAAGKQSEWSTAWFFIVEMETGPETPLLVSPANGTISEDNTPIFSWSCDETDGVSFILEVGNSDFSTITLSTGDIVGLTYTPSAEEALADGTYYWHVKTIKGDQESGWSDAWSVAIETAPPMATIIGAPSGTVNYATADITVGGDGIVAYKYKLDNGGWSNETPIDTHISLSGLSEGEHTLYVIGGSALGHWQAEADATTAIWTVNVNITPTVATLSGQPTGTVNYSTADITVGGTDVVAYKYELDSGTWSDETPVGTHIALSGLSDGSHTVSVIGKSALDLWQAEADATTASWTVDTTAPSVPSLLSPANQASTSDKTPILDWSDVTDPSGVSYSLQIDDDADFSSPMVSREGLTGSTYTLTNDEDLSKGTYYWRVEAVDGVGNASGWTSPFSFSVTASSTSKGTAAWVWVVIGLVIVGLGGGLAYSIYKRQKPRRV